MENFAEGANIRRQSRINCQRVEPPWHCYGVPRDNAFHRYWDPSEICGFAFNDGMPLLKTQVNCEACSYMRVSSRDALSEINSSCPAGTDFHFVFRDTDLERVDVPA
jgi:hypothetical protein